VIVLIPTPALLRLRSEELDAYWVRLALFLNGKVDRKTGRLPPRYQSAYDDVRAEFDRRGVQLMLFRDSAEVRA